MSNEKNEKEKSIIDRVEQLASRSTLAEKHNFLLTWEHSKEEIELILAVAELLRYRIKNNRHCRVFDSGLAVSIFRDKSTRTRFSFASAANLLGLAVQELDEQKTQVSHGETTRETAVMISFLTRAIGIRDDMFIGQGHEYMVEVGDALDEAFVEGILIRRPSLVNLQCDRDHPTQTMADLAFLIEQFGSIEALRGKKIAMSWAYSPSYGKPLSVPQGIISLMTRLGMEVVLSHPRGYELMPEIVAMAQKQATESGGTLSVTDSMEEAFRDADIVYPKSWAPYQVMKQRTELLSAGDIKGLDSLEQECLRQNAKHTSWECNEDKMALTRNGDALYLHCLPADISGVSCAQGEVSRAVFDRYRLRTYGEASWKPFIIAAMILMTQVKEVSRVLE